MSYDLLLVGGGITAATCAAVAKEHGLRVCVVETRNHIGGNCFDWCTQGTFVHQYGPHIFHTHSQRIVHFLSRYTTWLPIEYSVTAEIQREGQLVKVPFPYCRQTEKVLGYRLSEPEVIDAFFRGYSQKMWGLEWEKLPPAIRARVPKDTQDKPVYFPGQVVAMPEHGYTRMIENMLDGVEVVLGADPDEWRKIPARQVVYTGRVDHLLEETRGSLGYRSLDIRFTSEPEVEEKAAVINFCSLAKPYTRKTHCGVLTGGDSSVVSYETPRSAFDEETAPYYPIPLPENQEKFSELKRLINHRYPGLILAGRLATYKYIDMDQAVAQALAVCRKELGFQQWIDSLKNDAYPINVNAIASNLWSGGDRVRLGKT